MKILKLLTVCLMLLLCGCQASASNPATGTVYTGSISEEGVGLIVKPPFWDAAIGLYNWLTD